MTENINDMQTMGIDKKGARGQRVRGKNDSRDFGFNARAKGDYC